jgi:hypothetical protein
MAGKEETPKCRKKTVTRINEMIEDLIEILMNTHKFWREIQQTKWHFWEERRVLYCIIMYNCMTKEIKVQKEVNMGS